MESSITERAREFMESSRKKKKKKKKKREENERAGELLESSGSKGKKKRMRSFWKVEVKKKKKERMWTMVYVCGGQNTREKKRGKGNVWMKERQRIRNHNLKILPQYFHNKF